VIVISLLTNECHILSNCALSTAIVILQNCVSRENALYISYSAEKLQVFFSSWLSFTSISLLQIRDIFLQGCLAPAPPQTSCPIFLFLIHPQRRAQFVQLFNNFDPMRTNSLGASEFAALLASIGYQFSQSGLNFSAHFPPVFFSFFLFLFVQNGHSYQFR
jgi:hypothetical protein